MSNHKNQNSILVLATLGVYLGLVLAGATPQVLAQAATATQFNVKDEVEAKDDLDNKPGDLGKARDRQLAWYFDGVSLLLDGLKAVPAIERSSWNYETNIYSPCPVTGFYDETASKLSVTAKLADLIRTAAARVGDLNRLASCLPSDRFKDHDRTEARNLVFRLDQNDRGLKYEVSISRIDKADSFALFNEFRQAVHRLDSSQDDVIAKTLRNNTIFSSADNQVTITTRLPRGSLDSLLAIDAK